MQKKITKSAAPVIDPSNPWADDVFEREIHGKRLTMLVERTPGSFVIAIKAPFGSGKSVFLNRWEAHLESVAKIPVVKLDAWKSDYLVDPLEALVVALATRLERIPDTAVESLKRRAEQAIKNLVNYGAKLLPKILRLGLAIKTLGISEVAIDAAELVASTSDLLPEAKERAASIEGFANAICEAKATLTEGNLEAPLIFILDELDRCRPDFAIKMLERIKHLFDMPGIIFAIAMDGENLPAAVESLYGQSIKGERYLRKFFDMEFYLPEPTIKQVVGQFFIENGLVRAQSTLKLTNKALQDAHRAWLGGTEIDQTPFETPDAPQLAVAFETFVPGLRLTLRDLVQTLTALVAVMRSVGKQEKILPVPLALAICLRFAHPKLFREILDGKNTLSQMYLSPTHSQNHGVEKLELIALPEGCYVHKIMQFFCRVGDKEFDDAQKTLESEWSLQGSNSTPEQTQRRRYAKDFLGHRQNWPTTPNKKLRELLNIAGTFVPPDEF